MPRQHAELGTRWVPQQHTTSTRTTLSQLFWHLQAQGHHHQETATRGFLNPKYFSRFLTPLNLNIFIYWAELGVHLQMNPFRQTQVE